MILPTTINIHAPTRTEYVTRTVHEHRAPTDESVRLLKEMEEKARDKVVQSIRLDGNEFKCVIQMFVDNMSDQRVAHIIFELNGKRLDDEVRIPMREENPGAIALAIRDQIAHTVAREVVGVALVPAMKDFAKWGRIE